MSAELHAIHGSSGAGSVNNCAKRVADGGAGLSGAYGDWDYGYYKADCPNGKVAVGVSKKPSTGKVHSILCCT